MGVVPHTVGAWTKLLGFKPLRWNFPGPDGDAAKAPLLGVDPRTLAKAIEAGQVPVVVLGQVVRVPVSWLRSQLRV